MRCADWLVACLLALGAAGPGLCGEPPGGEWAPGSLLQRWHPAGGWEPYGGGLLHWWDPHCFPRCGGPDDYCRKKLPCVCWPPYPPYYIDGPAAPANAPPCGDCRPAHP
jgi:hypothetical protein